MVRRSAAADEEIFRLAELATSSPVNIGRISARLAPARGSPNRSRCPAQATVRKQCSGFGNGSVRLRGAVDRLVALQFQGVLIRIAARSCLSADYFQVPSPDITCCPKLDLTNLLGL